MPRLFSRTTRYESLIQLNIKVFNDANYFKERCSITDTLKWNLKNGDARVKFTFDTITEGREFIEVSYKVGDKARNYNIGLVCVPSNLGIGDVWYFVCPKIQKRCRILYFRYGFFAHREANFGAMYRSQTESKLSRTFSKYFKDDEIEKAYNEIYSKGFTKYYRGKPTRRYQRLLKKIEKADRYSLEALETLEKRLYYSLAKKV